MQSYGTIIVGVLSLCYSIFLNVRTNRIHKKIQEVQLDVLQASSLYENVKKMKREYVQAMTDLQVIKQEVEERLESSGDSMLNSTDKSHVNRAFLNLYQKYTDFFNEVEDYCTKVNVGAIKAEEYIKEKVAPNISAYAKLQVETFEMLTIIAQNYNFKKVLKPDYNAFKEYDIFLIKYNGGEESAFWKDLKTSRSRVGFE